jgi:hypothetical protein
MVGMMTKSTERVKKWIENHPDERSEQNRRAALRYREKNKDNPEFMERLRETNRKSRVKRYHEKRAAMTEEELEEYRKKTRERIAKYRAKKKAEKLALEAADNETD